MLHGEKGRGWMFDGKQKKIKAKMTRKKGNYGCLRLTEILFRILLYTQVAFRELFKINLRNL
jgi:hypothetical protein